MLNGTPASDLNSSVPLSVMQVDKPWEDVYKSLPEPLYRHQYGT